MHTARMSAISVVRRHGVSGARPCATRRRGPRSSLTAAAIAVCLASLVLTPPAAGAADRPGAPGNIGASWNTTTPTSLDVTWTSPGGSYLEYQVMYRTDAGTVWDPDPAPVSVGWKSAAGTVTALSRTIAGLDASATYVIAVRARSRVTGLYGVWGISGLIEPSGTPGRPSGITESARSATSLTVEWPKVADAAGGYDLRIAEHAVSPAWSTAATVKVSQPGGGTASEAVATANLPSSYAVSKTYVAQVRSRSSASGTCGSGGVKCSRWVTSGQLAQLDISGLTAVKNRNGGDPSHVRTDRLDVDVTWDALPSSLSDVSYELRFSWRNGQPSRFYDGSTGRPSGWVQDWQWWTLCNDNDASNNPSGPQDTGDVDGDNDVTECLDPYNRTPPYLEPVWAFGPPEWGSVVTVADNSANCTGSGSARTCSHTFTDATVSYLTDEVQIQAVVGTGQSARYGPRTYFTTSPVRAPGRPYGLSVSAPTGSSVKLVWSVPYDRGSAITGYDLELVDAATGRASATVTGTKGTPAPPIPGDGSTRLSYTFSGVTSNKTYTVSVRAVNAKGAGSWRRSGNIALTPTVPGAPLLSAAPGGKGSGKLTLTAELENTGGAAVTSWKRRLKTGNTYGAWTTIPSASGSPLSAVVSNLTNGTSYTYQVQACNSAGCGTASNDATSTPVNVPSAVTSPTAGSGRNGYVFLGGTATDNGSPITHWEYQYKQTSSAGAYSAWSSNWTVDHTSSPGSLDARVGGLTNGTGYSFRIRAVNIGGPGPQSAELTATPAERTKPKVNLTLTPSSISEGGTATVTAAFPWGFTSTHATTVTVAVAPTSPATASDYTLSSNVTLTIPAYTEAGTGTVTIAAVDDSLDENGEILAVSATVSNSSTQGVTAPDSQTLVIADDDTAAIVPSKTSLAVTEGTPKTYTVRLGSQPTSSVTLTLTGTNSLNTSVSPLSLTFTTSNWNTAQTVTVNPADDTDGTGGTFSISHSAASSDAKYNSLAAKSVSVSVTDDDVPTAPAAPTWDPKPLTTSVDVTWAAPAYAGSSGATIKAYQLRYASSGQNTWTTVDPSPATSTTVTLSSLTTAATYDVQVRAQNNSDHWGPWSASTEVTPGAADAPTGLLVTTGNQSLTVSWTSTTSLNGATRLGELVTWACGQATTGQQLVTTLTSHTITGLTNGVECLIGVATFAFVGFSPVAGPAASTTATPTAGT